MEAFRAPILAKGVRHFYKYQPEFYGGKAGYHKTKSADLLTSTEPSMCGIACATVGFMVYLEMLRIVRKLSAAGQSMESSEYGFTLSVFEHFAKFTLYKQPKLIRRLAKRG
ncbi:hypothetical protein OAG94_02260 [bacterium]|nr:hypothetical protein [bacterium]